MHRCRKRWTEKQLDQQDVHCGKKKVATLLQAKITDKDSKVTSLRGTSLEIWSDTDKPFTVRIFAYDKDDATPDEARRYNLGEVSASTPEGEIY